MPSKNISRTLVILVLVTLMSTLAVSSASAEHWYPFPDYKVKYKKHSEGFNVPFVTPEGYKYEAQKMSDPAGPGPEINICYASNGRTGYWEQNGATTGKLVIVQSNTIRTFYQATLDNIDNFCDS